MFLLDNAIKYGRGSLRVSQSRAGDVVRVEIESAGDGPTDEELSQAFELLYRGEHAVMTAPGLGIGLAVARELMRADGGDVTLERRGAAVIAALELPA
jgi:protein-histidine pros-kinase